VERLDRARQRQRDSIVDLGSEIQSLLQLVVSRLVGRDSAHAEERHLVCVIERSCLWIEQTNASGWLLWVLGC